MPGTSFSARSAHPGRCSAELHQAAACASLFPAPPHSLPAMQDAWEFRGLRHLWWFLLYFVYTIVFIGFNWSENAVSTSVHCGLTPTVQPEGICSPVFQGVCTCTRLSLLPTGSVPPGDDDKP